LERQQRREEAAELHQIINALGYKILSLAGHASIGVQIERHWQHRDVFGRQQNLRESGSDGNQDVVIATAARKIAECVEWLREPRHLENMRPRTSTLPHEVRILYNQIQSVVVALGVGGLDAVRARAYSADLFNCSCALADLVALFQRAGLLLEPDPSD
jgi:hypothetical protein